MLISNQFNHEHSNKKKIYYRRRSRSNGHDIVPQVVTAQQTPAAAMPQKKGPPLDKELVKEFVIAGHKDLDKVKLMLQENADLLNACFNWKDWDWEGGCDQGVPGHMGFRDMALYLLEQGARPTICVAAMLGRP